jgi:glutathione S-transferase
MLADAMTDTVKLYVLPGSHPCAAVEAALELKGVEYRRVNLLPLIPVAIGPLLWGGPTVPGMRIGSERLVGSRRIMRRLDELAGEPPLLPPPGDAAYARVLEAERWGEEVLQPVPRRIIDAVFVRRPATMETFAEDMKLPVPRSFLRPVLPLTARLMAIKNGARDEAAKADLAALPRQLDRVDELLAEGLLGGEQPNAAGLQIGSSIRLFNCIGDVAPLLSGRPSLRMIDWFQPTGASIPAGILPADWLPSQPARDGLSAHPA